MANEEIRGEDQDPNLIGLSAPGPVSGLGGSLAANSPAAASGASVPYTGHGVDSVYPVIPVNGKKFVWRSALNPGDILTPGIVNFFDWSAGFAPGNVPYAHFPGFSANAPFKTPPGFIAVIRSIEIYGTGEVVSSTGEGASTTIMLDDSYHRYTDAAYMPLLTMTPVINGSILSEYKSTALSITPPTSRVDGLQIGESEVFIIVDDTDVFSFLVRVDNSVSGYPFGDFDPDKFLLNVEMHGELLLKTGLPKNLEIA